MATFAGGVAALTVLSVLLIALVEHGVRPASLPRALAAQQVLPRALAVPVAVGVVAAEAALPLLGGLGMARGADGVALLRFSLGAAAVLFAIYALYTRHLVTARDAVPCGCGGEDTPVSRWVVGRALALAGTALVGLVLADRVVDLGGAERFAVALAAGLTFALLLWHLPAAMEDPVKTMLQHGRQRLLRQIREGQAHEL